MTIFLSKDYSQFSTECTGPVGDSIQVQKLASSSGAERNLSRGEVEGEARHTEQNVMSGGKTLAACA